jgi:hypothetical protein
MKRLSVLKVVAVLRIDAQLQVRINQPSQI